MYVAQFVVGRTNDHDTVFIAVKSVNLLSSTLHFVWELHVKTSPVKTFYSVYQTYLVFIHATVRSGYNFCSFLVEFRGEEEGKVVGSLEPHISVIVPIFSLGVVPLFQWGYSVFSDEGAETGRLLDLVDQTFPPLQGVVV